MDVDKIITAITEAPDEASALATLAGVPRATLLAVADQLYLDAYGRASATVRRAIVNEAGA
jgi:hypothetical protein